MPKPLINKLFFAATISCVEEMCVTFVLRQAGFCRQSNPEVKTSIQWAPGNEILMQGTHRSSSPSRDLYCRTRLARDGFAWLPAPARVADEIVIVYHRQAGRCIRHCAIKTWQGERSVGRSWLNPRIGGGGNRTLVSHFNLSR